MHNIVADGWAGASNPHPNPNPHPTYTNINKIYLKRLFFPLFNLMTPGPTDGRMESWTDKASYTVACPQLTRTVARPISSHERMGRAVMRVGSGSI